MQSNQPEKPHFDRILRVELEIAERREDLKALWQSAKNAELDVRLMKRAVKLALEDEDKRDERRELERKAQEMIEQLGPLGEAAVRAAQ